MDPHPDDPAPPPPELGSPESPIPLEATEDDLLVVGKVVAAQGLKGELRVLPMSDFPERFTRPGRRWLQRGQDAARAVELKSGRQLPGKELFVVRLAEVDSREAAEALVGQSLLVRARDRPRLARGEFHLLDLVGLEVRLLDTGARVGTVTDLVHAGQDLLQVEAGGRLLLIPFVAAIVPEVNLDGGWIGITPPPGLLEL
ncbi:MULTISPECIES: ribosome maturation factor RimM [Aphanothece]|uniref:ribosome maturation factor RimM n=1 Tax=Aphanothece TaxID=1121 RepID=UPI0039847430